MDNNAGDAVSKFGTWTLPIDWGVLTSLSIQEKVLINSRCDQGRREQVRAPVRKFFRAPSKGGPVKIFTLNRKD
jgi:hypothetical protein